VHLVNGAGCALVVPASEFQQHRPQQLLVARADAESGLHERPGEGRDVPARGSQRSQPKSSGLPGAAGPGGGSG
jgi:hypothetical protein